MGAEEVVGDYKGLSAVERAFRSLKTVGLKIRPIYHWLDDRVRSHVLLCMLAYYVEWHMRKRLVPVLYDDEHRHLVEDERVSVVAPAVSLSRPGGRLRRNARCTVSQCTVFRPC